MKGRTRASISARTAGSPATLTAANAMTFVLMKSGKAETQRQRSACVSTGSVNKMVSLFHDKRNPDQEHQLEIQDICVQFSCISSVITGERTNCIKEIQVHIDGGTYVQQLSGIKSAMGRESAGRIGCESQKSDEGTEKVHCIRWDERTRES